MRQKEKKTRGSYTETLKVTFLIIDDHKIDEIARYFLYSFLEMNDDI